MAADKEAISLSSIYSYYSTCNAKTQTFVAQRQLDSMIQYECNRKLNVDIHYMASSDRRVSMLLHQTGVHYPVGAYTCERRLTDFEGGD